MSLSLASRRAAIASDRKLVDPSRANYKGSSSSIATNYSAKLQAAGRVPSSATLTWIRRVIDTLDTYYGRDSIDSIAIFSDNAGGGSVAYSVVGPNWIVSGSPTWGTDGIAFTDQSAGMSFAHPFPRLAPMMIGANYNITSLTYSAARRLIGDTSGYLPASGSAPRILWDTGFSQFSALNASVQTGYNPLFPVSTGNNVLATAFGAIGNYQSGNGFPASGNSALMISKRWVSWTVPSPSTADYNAAMTLAGSLTYNIVAIGDSLTHGRALSVKIRNHYVAQLETLLSLDYGSIPNFGIQGRTAETMAANTSEWAKCKVVGMKSIALVWAGTNDLGLSGRTASQTQGYIDTVLAELIKFGFTPVVLTLLPSTSFSSFGAGVTNYNTQAPTLNTALSDSSYSNGTKAFATVAVHSISELADTTNRTYNADGIHLTEAGYGLVAQAVYAAITSLL